MANEQTRGAGYEFVWRGDDMRGSVRNNSRAGMEQLAAIAMGVMQSRVPVDTGFLKSTLFTRITDHSSGPQLEFGATAFYALFVELGTSVNVAQPFIRPAADAVQSHAAQAFKQMRDSSGRFASTK